MPLGLGTMTKPLHYFVIPTTPSATSIWCSCSPSSLIFLMAPVGHMLHSLVMPSTALHDPSPVMKKSH